MEPTPPNTSVEIHNLSVAYDRKPVLWNIEVSLPQGELIAIVGPNGAGKSTLLKAALGLTPIDSGYVKILGKELAEIRDKIGYVPQRESVDWNFPVTVFDVVLMGCYQRVGWLKRPSQVEKSFASECIEKVGLTQFQHRQISQLSGGQQQRVFVARALAQRALVYFMDEPFAGVDTATERSILQVLDELKQAGNTVIVVHHSLQTVAEHFDSVVLLNGSIIAAGAVTEVLTSDAIRSAYGGKLTLLEDLSERIRKREEVRWS